MPSTAGLPAPRAGPQSPRAAPPAPRAAPPAPRAAPPVALYVHVPFCVSLCPYCDFVVYAGADARGPRARIDAYLGALSTEIGLRADALDARFGRPGSPAPPGSSAPPGSYAHPGSSAPPGSYAPPGSPAPPGSYAPPGSPARPPLDTLYLGGGTPSLLPAGAIGDVLDAVRARFGLAEDAEITIEANPGPDERGDARALAAAGVTRLSLGAQSLDPRLLRRLGRRHAPRDVAAAVSEARQAGLRSVSLDLLYDVPGQTLDAWAATLDGALALEPDHISAYALTLDDPDAEGLTGPAGDHLPTRPGPRRWRAIAATEQDPDRAAAQYELAVERLAAAGLRGYEISNWARPGHESRHNLVYWTRQPYEAVGPGAHAFDGATRRWNAARLAGYLAALAPADGSPPRTPPGGSELVDWRAAAVETTILGLRLDTGLAREAAEGGPLGPHLAWATTAGLLESFGAADGPRIRLTTRGRLLSNELFQRLV